MSVIFPLCVDPDPERAVCLPSVEVEAPCAGEFTAVSVKPPPSSRCVVCVAETALTLQACGLCVLVCVLAPVSPFRQQVGAERRP